MADLTPIAPAQESSDDLLPWGDKLRFQKLFSVQATRSYLYLSLGIGLLAFLLPIALVLFGGYHGNYSISYFYHASNRTRNILVGSLWAIGVFLFLFQGLSRWENRILNLAGIAAIGVAMFPMKDEQRCDEGWSLHAASAITLFLCLAVVAIGFSKTRIQYIIYPPKRQRFATAYNLAGLAMIAMPATVAALHLLGDRRCDQHTIFWVETFGIWAFAAYWFVKTAEYKILLRVKWRPARFERREVAKEERRAS